MKKGDDPIEANHAEQQFTKYIHIYYTKFYSDKNITGHKPQSLSWPQRTHLQRVILSGFLSSYRFAGRQTTSSYSCQENSTCGFRSGTSSCFLLLAFKKKKFLISNARWSLLESNPVIGTCPQRWWHRFPSFLSILSTYKINYE